MGTVGPEKAIMPEQEMEGIIWVQWFSIAACEG
jgi:hypothetical protein